MAQFTQKPYNISYINIKMKKPMQHNRIKKKIYDKIKGGHLDSALSKIKQIEKKETLDWNLMYWAGLCHYLKKDLDVACSYFEQSITANVAKNQYVASIYSALGIAQQEKGELNKAIASLQKSILLREKSTASNEFSINEENLQTAHHSLATTYSLKADKEKNKEQAAKLDSLALDHFFQALKLEGNELEETVPKILDRIMQSPEGKQLFEKGNVEKIVLNKLRYDSSRFILFMGNFGSQFFKIGETEEGIKWIETAIGYIDKNHEYWFSLNNTLKQMKQK